MSSNPMNKWHVDLIPGGQRSVSRAHDASSNPPGFNPTATQGAQHVERTQQDHQQQQHLMSKRAWDMALQPIKSLPMNMLMMYSKLIWTIH
jgi:hypothetical protein